MLLSKMMHLSEQTPVFTLDLEADFLPVFPQHFKPYERIAFKNIVASQPPPTSMVVNLIFDIKDISSPGFSVITTSSLGFKPPDIPFL